MNGSGGDSGVASALKEPLSSGVVSISDNGNDAVSTQTDSSVAVGGNQGRNQGGNQGTEFPGFPTQSERMILSQRVFCEIIPALAAAKAASLIRGVNEFSVSPSGTGVETGVGGRKTDPDRPSGRDSSPSTTQRPFQLGYQRRERKGKEKYTELVLS